MELIGVDVVQVMVCSSRFPDVVHLKLMSGGETEKVWRIDKVCPNSSVNVMRTVWLPGPYSEKSS